MSTYALATKALYEERFLLLKVIGGVVFATAILFFFARPEMGILNKVMPYLMFAGIIVIPILYTMLLAYFYKKHVVDETEALTFGEAAYLLIQMLIVGFLRELAVVVLMLLFIVPGIMFAVYWNFAFDEIISQRSTWFHALEASSKRVEGRWWHVFFETIVQQIVFLVMLAIVFGVGMLLFALIKMFVGAMQTGGVVLSLGSGIMVGMMVIWSLWCQCVHMFYYKQCTPLRREESRD